MSHKNSTSTKTHVFIFVSSKTCPHCISFKNDYWDECKRRLKDLKSVGYIEIELDRTSDNSTLYKYNSDLAKYVRWYPNFLLVPIQTWQNKGKLHGMKMFNATYDPSLDTYTHVSNQSSKPITSKYIIDWVDKELRFN